jgi:ornithine cyclodeaminase
MTMQKADRPDAANNLTDPSGALLVLSRAEVMAVLSGHEQQILELVEQVYREQTRTNAHFPHAAFLFFPDNPGNRIIALPAYLNTSSGAAAGVKWIASFPGNIDRGIERASAMMILNAPDTGRPLMVCEAYRISSHRTAASAAIAARLLADRSCIARLGFIGCGAINAEVAKFLTYTFDGVGEVSCHDLARPRAESFVARISATFGKPVTIAGSSEEVLATCEVVSIATTAGTPHIESIGMCPAGATILHLSVRDLSVAAILSADNVVDDPEHVCQQNTSLHLARDAVGHNRFIRATLGEILRGERPPRACKTATVVFSPFGLGTLDVVVARLVFQNARSRGLGVQLRGYFDEPQSP